MKKNYGQMGGEFIPAYSCLITPTTMATEWI